MNSFKNERGAALVLTLMIITLLLLFVMTLFFQLTNTAKQVQTVEHTIDARLIAEMGIEYYRSQVDNFTNEEPIEKFLKDLDLNVTLDENHSFEIKKTGIEKNDETIVIKIESTGIAFDENKTIDDTLTINLP